MSEAERIRNLVAERVRQKGLVETRLSTQIGRNRAYISQYIQRRTPEALPESVRVVLAPYLDLHPDDLKVPLPITLEPARTPSQPPLAPKQASVFPDALSLDKIRSHGVPAIASLPRDIPVYGIAVGGKDGDFQFNGTAIDYVRRPPGIIQAHGVFAIYVVGESMSPRYEEGDLVFVHPGRQPRSGDDVVIEMHGTESEPSGHCYIKKLIRRTPSVVLCQQYNPAMELNYQTEHIKRIYKILTTAELLGV